MTAAQKARAEADIEAGAEAANEIVAEYQDADGTTMGVTAEGNHVELEADEPDVVDLAVGEMTVEEMAVSLRVADLGIVPAEQVAGLAPGLELEMVAVGLLKEHPKNANHGDVEAIGRSVSESGFYGAVVVQRSTGYILAGNHRYRVAVEKGLREVPVTWVDVDAIGAVRIMLADNETARRGHMDLAAQDALIQELKVVDPELKGSGFDVALSEIAAAEAAEEEAAAAAEAADREPADPVDYGAKYGVIVMCRDEAHQVEVYERLSELELGELRVVAV